MVRMVRMVRSLADRTFQLCRQPVHEGHVREDEAGGRDGQEQRRGERAGVLVHLLRPGLQKRISVELELRTFKF